MMDYFNSVCQTCDRRTSCLYPCQEYVDFYREQDLKEQEKYNNQKDIHILHLNVDHLTDEKKQEIMRTIEECSGRLEVSNMNMSISSGDDIENFLEYEVENIEWLRCLNGQIPILDILDKNTIYEYLREQNEKYCEEQSLCPICRNPLKEYKDEMINERYWACQYGC